jgi:hypothetical protein
MASLDELFEQAHISEIERLKNWEIRRDGDVIRLALTARDGERYRVVARCDDYENTLPSIVFVDEAGSMMTPSAWPRGTQEIQDYIKPPPHCFVCTDLTREGIQHHPEWNTGQKKSDVLGIFNLLQRLLDSPSYQGRAQ